MIDLTPLDVRKKKEDFKRTVRGYDPMQVDGFLEVVADRLEQLVRERGSLADKVEHLDQQLSTYQERERALNEALLAAQELREEARSQAERDASVRLREAETHAEAILLDADQAIRHSQRRAEDLRLRRAQFLKSLRMMLERFEDYLELEDTRLEGEPEDMGDLLERLQNDIGKMSASTRAGAAGPVHVDLPPSSEPETQARVDVDLPPSSEPETQARVDVDLPPSSEPETQAPVGSGGPVRNGDGARDLEAPTTEASPDTGLAESAPDPQTAPHRLRRPTPAVRVRRRAKLAVPNETPQISRSTPMAYRPIPESVEGLEQDVLRRWDEEGTFERSLAARADAQDFVFFEGPPTANGRPGVHHILARTIKDVIARYRTMAGYHVPRKAGWDTHGLPVELESERQLGISGKPEIERLGIQKFNDVCRQNVFTYQDDWERLSRRIGYWLNYDDPYVTCSPDFIESAWWALSEIEKRGLLYRGYRVVPYCPRCGTGLSSHEVAQGYKDVNEPAVTMKFHLIDDPDDARVLSWTTTPWTLPGNLGLAVGADIIYARVRILGDGAVGATDPGRGHDGPGGAAPGEVLILASERVSAVIRHPYEILAEMSGSELAGRRYAPLFPGAIDATGFDAAWTVLEADFVTVDDGTGVVHTAVMYGEDDFRLGKQVGLPMQHIVGEDGRFLEEVPGGLARMYVKDKGTERAIRDWVVEHDQLYLREMYEHSYPHCWRCDSALLYMARDSWYIRTTAVKDRLLEHNASIDWHPPETGTGRMGEWLSNNVDWALSRERYWGTPLPIWLCSEDEEHRVVIGSFQDLGSRVGGLPEGFDPHRPGIDVLEWDCDEEGCSGCMRRVPEVADAWFDSGSVPFAQWHYPFENHETFERYFPADYIAEGVDQTRGWFYSLLALSTILFDRAPFRAAVVNDQVLDARGQKMAKSRGNAVDPWEALDTYGADVTRFYFISGSNPWVPKRWDPSALRETDRKLFATLRHTYRFFALYANEDGWSHVGHDALPASERGDLDRWVLARLDRVVATVGDALEVFDLTTAARAIQGFVLDDVSNWFVRRSRDRFWATQPGTAADSAEAFATLHECLVVAARLLAPFAPFISDWLHRALSDDQSVHLADFPEPVGYAAPELEQAMEDVRRLVALGRAARQEAGVGTRQPLSALHAVVPEGRELSDPMTALLIDELNVKQVVLLGQSRDLVGLSAKARFGVLGPKHGPRTPVVARAIEGLPSSALERLRAGEAVEVEVDGEQMTVDPEEVAIVEETQTELAMASGAGYVAALDTELTNELRAEGYAREIVNRVQRIRRDVGLEVADRIRLGVVGPEVLERAAAEHTAYIAGETLALEVLVGQAEIGGLETTHVQIDDFAVAIGVERTSR